MTIRMGLKGGDELARKFENLADAVADDLAENVNASAEVIREEAERLAPERRPRTQVVIEEREHSRTKAVAAIGPDEREGLGAFFQEIGTRHHPPQAWLRPGFDASEGRAKDEMGDRVWDTVERAARG